MPSTSADLSGAQAHLEGLIWLATADGKEVKRLVHAAERSMHSRLKC